MTEHNMQIFRVIPYFKIQNNNSEKWDAGHLSAFGCFIMTVLCPDWTQKWCNKIAQSKADKYPTSHFSLLNSSLSVVL